MVTSPEKQMRSDLSVTNGFNVSDYSTTESARQDAALMQSNARNRTSGRTERRDPLLQQSQLLLEKLMRQPLWQGPAALEKAMMKEHTHSVPKTRRIQWPDQC